MPERQSRRQAGLLAALAVSSLALASGGLAAGGGDGRADLLAASFLGLIGLANLALALGSLLPEARGGWAFRSSTRPIVLLALLAALAWLVLSVRADEGAPLLVPAAVGAAAVLAVGWWRRRSRNGTS
jgi:hypothetical protein